MNIIADENLEREIVLALRVAGHVVLDIKESSPGIDDRQVLAIANESSSVLLTNDKDFGDLVFKERLFSSGVLLLRFGKLEMAERIDLLIELLDERADEIPHAFTVLTSVGVRIRK
mgnify:CR=1 FL=1